MNLGRSRVIAAQLMTDSATVTRPAAPATLNTSTGVLEPPAATAVYSGSCRVRAASDQNEGQVVFGERLTTTDRHVVWFPWDVANIHIGDLIAVQSCTDPQLTGRTMRAVSIVTRTHLHYREVNAELTE